MSALSDTLRLKDATNAEGESPCSWPWSTDWT
jgi:hypothetical protein